MKTPKQLSEEVLQKTAVRPRTGERRPAQSR